MQSLALSGLFTAMITPFVGAALDLQGFRENLKAQVHAGVDGIVVAGSTGEGQSLSIQEWEQLIHTAVEHAGSKLHISAGIPANTSREALALGRRAKALGADSLLVMVPHYHRPTQQGIFSHFEQLTQAEIPIIIYNNPGRAGVTIDPLTLRQLAQLPGIVGLKDCSGSIAYAADVLHHTQDLGKPFAILAGDDIASLALLAMGGHGLISTLGNLLPDQMVHLIKSRDRHTFFELVPLFKAMGFEPNPIPIKEAMNQRGWAAGPCRLPLTPMSESHKAALHALLGRVTL
ncbi:MAG: 4-hydroxy-tetrahydrodipicolinate synthase [Verrucomicrobia bacterium]|nr:4-hydroxy-tetrahydrodipicolinate synthase [Verrucomicrobiota bacterium]